MSSGGATLSDHISVLREARANSWQQFLSREISTLLRAFYIINAIVLVLVAVLWGFQEFYAHDLQSKPPVMVSEKTVLALIAASTAQLGALVFSIGKGLLKGPPQVPP